MTPEFSTQRSTRILFVIAVLSLVGLVIAGYLSYAHFNDRVLVCAIGGCETVQSSRYATIGSIPIALLGTGMFALLFTLAVIRLSRGVTVVSPETASAIAWGTLLAAVLYYLYLTYLEVFVLHAICQWCVLSSMVALALFALESANLWRVVVTDELAEKEQPSS